MAFTKDQKIIYEGAGDKYKGTVVKVNPKDHGPSTFDVHLTAKKGPATTTQSVTKAPSTEAEWQPCNENKYNVLEVSLTRD